MTHHHQEELMGTTVADILQMVDGCSDTSISLPSMLSKLPEPSKTLFDTLQEHDSNHDKNYLQEDYHSTEREQTYSVLIPPQVPQTTKTTSTRRKGASKLSPLEKAELDKKISAHIKIQELFAQELSEVLDDAAAATSLQCCLTITNNKPCGCIRKYILNGSDWKKRELSANYLLQISPILDVKSVCEDDASMVGSNPQVRERASTLLATFHKAAELKKEKWYKVEEPTTAEENENGGGGKSKQANVKVKRRYIGLGNGRKRSKRYEEFVLSQRNILRKEHFLCEKAAQKLLGYSINFLYKKLRTDPQKKSRLVATNNTDRASKVSRNIISLDRLQEISDQHTASCCIRNCIKWFVNNHFEKIVSWRERLKDSDQRGTQEIVREVYLMQDADVMESHTFCLNLVHWITGCSFKKIRRVRDHLKKDPATLPEHGLKKYWKGGVSQQTHEEGEAGVATSTASQSQLPKRIVSTNGLYQIPLIDTVWTTVDVDNVDNDTTTDIDDSKPLLMNDVSSHHTYLTVATVTVDKQPAAVVATSNSGESGIPVWMPPLASIADFSQQQQSPSQASSSESPASSSS